MADCTNEAMRDLLPLLAHEGPGGDAGEAMGRETLDRLRAHVGDCAACRAELALLRSAASVIDGAVPRVDAAAISAGVNRALRLRIVDGAPRRTERRLPSRWMPRRQAAVAASLILVASASLAVLARTFGGPTPPAIDGGRVATTIDSAPVTRVSAGAGISVAGGLSDLSEEDLTTLLDELDRVEATIDAEPQSIRRAIVDVPEEF
jgi:hypothetical protein